MHITSAAFTGQSKPTHSPDSKRETQHLSMRRVVKSQCKDLYQLSEAAEDLQTVSLTG